VRRRVNEEGQGGGSRKGVEKEGREEGGSRVAREHSGDASIREKGCARLDQ
jgi:hypothetical protein